MLLAQHVSTQLEILRATVEAACTPPAVVLLTGAQPSDGSRLAALCLADTFARAGWAAGFCDASDAGVALVRDQRDARTPGGAVALSISRGYLEYATVAAIGSLFERLRREFEIAFVDVGDLSLSAGVRAADAADAFIVTVRLGRAKCEADNLLTEACDRLRSNVLGVIAMDGGWLDELTGDRAVQQIGRRVVSVGSDVEDERLRRAGAR